MGGSPTRRKGFASTTRMDPNVLKGVGLVLGGWTLCCASKTWLPSCQQKKIDGRLGARFRCWVCAVDACAVLKQNGHLSNRSPQRPAGIQLSAMTCVVCWCSWYALFELLHLVMFCFPSTWHFQKDTWRTGGHVTWKELNHVCNFLLTKNMRRNMLRCARAPTSLHELTRCDLQLPTRSPPAYVLRCYPP